VSTTIAAAAQGQPADVVLVAAEYLIGLGAPARATRMPAVTIGLALSLAFWVLGQDLGQLSSGQGTDPNSGPLARREHRH
jgi:hypothetical protein